MRKNEKKQSNNIKNENCKNNVTNRNNNKISNCNKVSNKNNNIGFENESKSFHLDDDNSKSFEVE